MVLGSNPAKLSIAKLLRYTVSVNHNDFEKLLSMFVLLPSLIAMRSCLSWLTLTGLPFRGQFGFDYPTTSSRQYRRASIRCIDILRTIIIHLVRCIDIELRIVRHLVVETISVYQA